MTSIESALDGDESWFDAVSSFRISTCGSSCSYSTFSRDSGLLGDFGHDSGLSYDLTLSAGDSDLSLFYLDFYLDDFLLDDFLSECLGLLSYQLGLSSCHLGLSSYYFGLLSFYFELSSTWSGLLSTRAGLL